ncbi:MAG TPA: AAA family ATPase [Candidatus Limnocylindria bacterium]|nr:AAA family ATPase [Candidatus Limnocylindria bacterium]
MKIIGLCGTNGAGKGTVGEMLVERHGFLFVSVSDLLREEARRRGLPVEREVLRTISAEWRREFGLGVLVDKAKEAFDRAGDKYKGLVVDPMRNPGEAQHLKDLGGVLVWVDADPRVRYGRIFSRKRSKEDDKTFEQFMAEEQAEMTTQGDAATLNMSAVKGKADIFLENNSDDLEAFKSQAEQQLALLLN